LIYSNDGIQWLPSTNGNTIFANTYPTAIAFNGSRWVAVGSLWQQYTDETQIAYSDDGKTWVKAVGWLNKAFMYSCNYLLWDGSKFIGADTNNSNGILYSYDGITWEKSPSSGFPTSIYSVGYNGKYYLTGNLQGFGGATTALLGSTNGINWSPITTPIGNFTISTIMWNGTYWLMGGGSALYMNSNYNPTGTWTQITLPVSGNVVQLVWNKVMWVGVVQTYPSPYGYLMYSYDGIHWIQASTSVPFFTNGSPNNPVPVSVAWNTNYWVAAGNDNIMLYSSDGRTWYSLPSGSSLIDSCYQITASIQPLFGTLQGFPFPNTNSAFMVASGNSSSGPKLIYSNDGINWLPSTNGNVIFTNTYPTAIAYSGSRWVAVGSLWQQNTDETQIAYSDDGKT
jgi:hypothetical protein